MSLTGEEKLETAPSDKRFPTTNQAKHCYMCAAGRPLARATQSSRPTRALLPTQVLQLMAPVQVRLQR